MIIIGIAAGRRRQRWLHEVRQAAIILDQIGRREAGELHPMRELVAGDDLGELGQEDQAGAEREGASAG